MEDKEFERLNKIIEQEEKNKAKRLIDEEKFAKQKASDDEKKFAEEKRKSEEKRMEEEKKEKQMERGNYRRKDGMSDHLKNYLVLGIFVLLFLIVLVLPISNAPIFEEKSGLPTCGDGTFYGTCSLNKPYYCSEGVLMEDAIRCGCPSGMEKMDSVCYEKEYYSNRGDIVLNYILNGEKSSFQFAVYPKLLDYLDTLPKFLMYEKGEDPRRDDFKLMKLDNPLQREALIPLVVAIQNAAPASKDDQARIAISLVQNIEYGEPEFSSVFGGKYEVRLSGYPYQTLSNYIGSCEGKSEILVFLLRELGFGTSLFYFKDENHEAVGIKCPLEYSYYNSGYCFVETTVPSPISFSTGTYLGIVGGKIKSEPQIVVISKGFSLGEDLDEYKDSQYLDKVLNSDGFSMTKAMSFKSYSDLAEKYGLMY